MPNEPRWLTADEVAVINRLTVAKTGEPHLVRDGGLLESACGVPQNKWSYGGVDDLAILATSLLFAVARNHPFVQGNKRTAFVAALQFLELNGWRLPEALDSTEFADRIVAVIEGVAEEESIASMMRALSRPA